MATEMKNAFNGLISKLDTTNERIKEGWDLAQVVECQPSKHKALNPNLSTGEKKE
jgi:hypothetical protein